MNRLKNVNAYGASNDANHNYSEQTFNTYQDLFNLASDSIMLLDPYTGKIIECNEQTLIDYGYSRYELSKLCVTDWDAQITLPQYQKIVENIESNSVMELERWHIRKDGSRFCAAISARRLEFNNQTCIYASMRDITELKNTQDKLYRMANYDSLTGMPNREKFMQVLETLLCASKRTGSPLVLGFFDIDRFKMINDSFGHRVGDALLIEVAKRVQLHCGDKAFLARLSGDEFVLCAQDVDSDTLGQSIIDAFATPFVLSDSLVVTVTTSIGLASYPQDAGDSSELLSHADLAMYEAKKVQGRHYEIFDQKHTKIIEERQQMEHFFKSLNLQSDLEMYYQPSLHLESGQLAGMEALLRCKPDSELGIDTQEWLKFAQKTGRMLDVSEFVFNRCFQQAHTWLEQGIKFQKIFINASDIEFSSGRLPQMLSLLLKRYHVPAQCIALEFSETIFQNSADFIGNQMAQIKRLGISMIVDNLGESASSITQIESLPIERIKLSKKLLNEVQDPCSQARLLCTYLTIAKEMQIEVVAGGIENKTQLDWLKQHNNILGQGYWISHPMPANDATAFIQNQS